VEMLSRPVHEKGPAARASELRPRLAEALAGAHG
jgi:hypothetical protein